MRWTEVLPQTPAAAGVPPTSRAISDRGAAMRTAPRIPGADHPWRRGVDQFRIDQQLAADRKAYAAVNP